MTRSSRAQGVGVLLAVLLAFTFLTLTPGRAQASKYRGPDSPRLYLAIWSADSLDPKGELSLGIWVFREWVPSVHPTECRVKVESGAKIEKRMTRSNFPPATATLWSLRLRKVGTGPIRVVATARVPWDSKHSYDFYRGSFDIGFEGTRVVRREMHMLESYSVEKGTKQQYRK